jgi:uncharacterized protein (DUF4415 family)
MITSKKLSAERVAEIKAFKNTDFSDCPVLTQEQLDNMKPRHPELYKLAANADAEVSIRLDADVLVWLKNLDDYELQVNNILRKVMVSQNKNLLYEVCREHGNTSLAGSAQSPN